MKIIAVDAVMISIMGFLLVPMFATDVSAGSKIIPRELQQSGLAMVFLVAQAGGSVFPGVTGVLASQAGVATLQPILVRLLAGGCCVVHCAGSEEEGCVVSTEGVTARRMRRFRKSQNQMDISTARMRKSNHQSSPAEYTQRHAHTHK